MIHLEVPNTVRNNISEYYDQTKISSSDCNLFVPYYSLIQGDLVDYTHKRVLMYNFPLTPTWHRDNTNYATLIQSVTKDFLPTLTKFKTSEGIFKVGSIKGCLWDSEGILFCLCVKSAHALSILQEQPVDTDKLAIFISPRFLNLPKFKVIRKKVELDYLSVLENVGIDRVVTTKINQWIFKNNFKKFQNIVELNNFLKEEVPKTLAEAWRS